MYFIFSWSKAERSEAETTLTFGLSDAVNSQGDPSGRACEIVDAAASFTPDVLEAFWFRRVKK